MNKPYFTKYIPVGDKQPSPLAALNLPDNSIIENKETGEEFIHHANGVIQKVKLFLCSRDIDYVKDVVDPNVEIHVYHDGSEEPFKVIGEVSPNAIWVKPDMEFSIEDLDKDGTGKIWFHPKTIFNGSIQYTYSKDYPYIKFKCPNCNTFH